MECSRGESRERGIQDGVGQIAQKLHFVMFCYLLLLFLLILVQLKHLKFRVLLPNYAKNGRGSGQIWPPVVHHWLNLPILIEEIPTLLTTHQGAYDRCMHPTEMAFASILHSMSHVKLGMSHSPL